MKPSVSELFFHKRFSIVELISLLVICFNFFFFQDLSLVVRMCSEFVHIIYVSHGWIIKLFVDISHDICLWEIWCSVFFSSLVYLLDPFLFSLYIFDFYLFLLLTCFSMMFVILYITYFCFDTYYLFTSPNFDIFPSLSRLCNCVLLVFTGVVAIMFNFKLYLLSHKFRHLMFQIYLSY